MAVGHRKSASLIPLQLCGFAQAAEPCRIPVKQGPLLRRRRWWPLHSASASRGSLGLAIAVSNVGASLVHNRRKRNKQRSLQLRSMMFAEASEAPQKLQGIEDLAAKYQYLTLDQYGVMHDGQNAYPGAAECLAKLHAAGCKAVILSNYAGRSAAQRSRLREIGLEPDHLWGLVTSGELAHRYLAEHRAELGSRALWVSWADRKNRGLGTYFEDLEGYSLAGSVDEADFLLLSGVESLYAGTPNEVATTYERDGIVDPFLPTLKSAAARDLLMICANPDVRVRRPGGWLAYLTGALAKHYEDLGGRVMHIGKPYGPVFEEARRVLSANMESTGGDLLDPSQICHVGDSLHHDVVGAANVGFHSAFVVRPGVHADELPENTEPTDVQALCTKEGTPLPTWIVPQFLW